jgi:2-iminoacetate synthase
MPSLCTACYREGRIGEQFRDLAQSESMKKFCHENAILSLKEYLEDCASPEVKEKLSKFIREEIGKSSNGLMEKIKLVDKGERDVHI